MVGIATRANNNHIQGAGIGKTLTVCGNSIEKLSMKGDRSYTGAAGKISNQ